MSSNAPPTASLGPSSAVRNASTSTQQPEETIEDVLLRVRFATGLTDLLHPLTRSLTAGDLKDAIRSRRASETKGRILRLIYLGKILTDDVRLSEVCRIPPPPPLAASASASLSGIGSGRSGRKVDAKGKTKVVERPAREVVLQCSIGSLISDLAKEAEQRRAGQLGLAPGTGGSGTPATASGEDDGGSRSTTPAPRGFDRLRQAGFDEADIAALRQQFFRGSAAVPGGSTAAPVQGSSVGDTQAAAGVNVGLGSDTVPTTTARSRAVAAIDVLDWTMLYDVELLADQPDPERDRERRLEAEERWMEEEAGPGAGLGLASQSPTALNDQTATGTTRQRDTMHRAAETPAMTNGSSAGGGGGSDSFGQAYVNIITGACFGFFVGFLGIFFTTEAIFASSANGAAANTPAGLLLGAVQSAGGGQNGWTGTFLGDRRVKACIYAGLFLNLVYGFCRE